MGLGASRRATLGLGPTLTVTLLQHALVPGCTYLSFLLSILNFLADHPWEIVVVELKSDGFVVKEDKYRDNDGDGKAELVVYSMIPSLAELEEMWEEARSLAEKEEARHVLRGGPEDMGRPIGELLDEKRRVIFIDQVHAPGSWARGDSYGALFAEGTGSAGVGADLSWLQITSHTTRTTLQPSSRLSRRRTPSHRIRMMSQQQRQRQRRTQPASRARRLEGASTSYRCVESFQIFASLPRDGVIIARAGLLARC